MSVGARVIGRYWKILGRYERIYAEVVTPVARCHKAEGLPGSSNANLLK
jgi:hypothetical protein